MKNKKIILIATFITLLSLGIGVVLSSFTSGDSVTNKFQAGEVNIDVDEGDFDNKNPPSWDNNKQPIEKIVSINNISVKNDCLLRVSIVPRWVEVDEQRNEKAWSGDTNLVELELKNIITKKGDNGWEANKWYQSNDGYYYYTSKLNRQEGNNPTPTSTILESVTVNVDLTKYPEYNGKELRVDVIAEAVQPTKEAYEACWTTVDNTVKNLLDNALGLSTSAPSEE